MRELETLQTSKGGSHVATTECDRDGPIDGVRGVGPAPPGSQYPVTPCLDRGVFRRAGINTDPMHDPLWRGVPDILRKPRGKNVFTAVLSIKRRTLRLEHSIHI